MKKIAESLSLNYIIGWNIINTLLHCGLPLLASKINVDPSVKSTKVFKRYY